MHDVATSIRSAFSRAATGVAVVYADYHAVCLLLERSLLLASATRLVDSLAAVSTSLIEVGNRRAGSWICLGVHFVCVRAGCRPTIIFHAAHGIHSSRMADTNVHCDVPTARSETGWALQCPAKPRKDTPGPSSRMHVLRPDL